MIITSGRSWFSSLRKAFSWYFVNNKYTWKYLINTFTVIVIKSSIFITNYKQFLINTVNKSMSLKTVLTWILKHVHWYSAAGYLRLAANNLNSFN